MKRFKRFVKTEKNKNIQHTYIHETFHGALQCDALHHEEPAAFATPSLEVVGLEVIGGVNDMFDSLSEMELEISRSTLTGSVSLLEFATVATVGLVGLEACRM